MKKYFFVFVTAISLAAIAASANYSNHLNNNTLQKKIIRDTIPDTTGNKMDTMMRDSSTLRF